MLTCQQTEEFLKCKICQKEFPKFDQRGFRNAGFTVHQNRCIEKEYLLKRPPAVDSHPSPPKQRLLLPVPSTSSSSSTTAMPVVARSNSSYPIHFYQQKPTMVVQPQHYPPSPPHPQHYYEHQGRYSLSTATGRTDKSIDRRVAPNTDTNEQAVINLSLSDSHNTMVFPVAHCPYCQPQHGLHQSSCVFLTEFLCQAPK